MITSSVGPSVDDLRQYFRANERVLRRQVAGYYREQRSNVGSSGRRSAAGFSGRWFDWWRHESPAGSFAAVDFIAVEALSVQFPAHAVEAILRSEGALFDGMLREIPETLSLWEVPDDVLAPSGPLQELYRTLRTFDGVDAVKASKLLALKRPHLVPIYDRAVEAFVAPPRDGFWQLMRSWLREQGARDEIARATDTAPQGIALLRRVDVAIWMQVEHPEEDT